MKRLLAYTRVSTKKQGERGASLPEQRAAIARSAELLGFHIIRWYDERLTAATTGRPQFAAMVKALSNKEADGVIVHNVDRSARNYRDWADISDLVDGGFVVYFANEKIDLSTRGGRLVADVEL